MRLQLVMILLATGLLSGQTRVDLRTQAKAIDFSQMPSTRPIRTGTALPGSCAVGELYFKTDAPAGANLYACTAADVWSVVAGSMGGVTQLTCAGGTNTAFVCDGSTQPITALTPGAVFTWIPNANGAGGPTTIRIGTVPALALVKSDGLSNPGLTDIRQNEPTLLYYDGTVARMVSGPPSTGSFQSVITDLKPTLTSTTLTIAPGRCWGADKAQAIVGIAGGTGSGSWVAYCTDTQAIVFEHATAAGLTVTCTNCNAIAVNSPAIVDGTYAIASGNITSGAFSSLADKREVVSGHRHTNGIGMDVQCAGGTCLDQVDPATVQLKADNYTPTGGFDASGATLTKPIRIGNTVPASCTAGELFYKVDAAAGARIYECNGGTFSLFLFSSLGTPSDVQVKTENYAPVADFDASAATTTKPVRTGTVLPDTCTSGEFFYKSDAAAGNRLYECASGAFALFTGATPTGVQLKSDNYAPTAQFDASGATLTRPMRVGTVVPQSCVTGEFFYKPDASAGARIYECNGGAFTVLAVADVQRKSDAYVPTSDFDASGASTTRPMKVGTNVPTTCAAGEFFYKSDATPGERVYECESGSFILFSAGTSAGPIPADVQLKTQNYIPTAYFDASGATMTKPFRTGTAVPASCSESEIFYKTDAPTGLRLYECLGGTFAIMSNGGAVVAKNGVYLQINGTNYLFPGMFAASLPNMTGFSWLANQGSSTATTTGTGGALVLNATTGVSGLRVFGKSLGTAKKITVAASCAAPHDGTTAQGCAFGFRDSGTGRLLAIRWDAASNSNGYLLISAYMNETTFSGNVSGLSGSYIGPQFAYLQIEILNGRLYFRTSSDGTNWFTRYSEAVGSFLTPNQWWLGLSSNTFGSEMVVYSSTEE